MSLSAIPPQKFTFHKSERLCGKRAFDFLFKHSSHLKGGMLKLLYAYPFPESLVNATVSFAVIVPKKILPRASDRNRTKRILREIIRLHKASLVSFVQEKGGRLVICIKWEQPVVPVFAQTESLVVELFQKVSVYISKKRR